MWTRYQVSFSLNKFHWVQSQSITNQTRERTRNQVFFPSLIICGLIPHSRGWRNVPLFLSSIATPFTHEFTSPQRKNKSSLFTSLKKFDSLKPQDYGLLKNQIRNFSKIYLMYSPKKEVQCIVVINLFLPTFNACCWWIYLKSIPQISVNSFLLERESN